MRRGLAAGTLILIGLSSPAPAHAAQAETVVSILNHDQSVSGSWYGTLESEKPKCLDGRKVTLFRKQNNGSKVRIGSTRAAMPGPTAGVWDILDESPRNGRYFASVRELEGCAAGRSKPYDYPEDQES